MSDQEAIAAVTKTLRGLILGALADVSGAGVDSKPLNEIATGTRDKLVNIYLFETDVDGALRNADRLDLAPGRPATSRSRWCCTTSSRRSCGTIPTSTSIGCWPAPSGCCMTTQFCSAAN